MPGVEDANVNLALERSTVHYDSSQLSTRELEQKILDLGYEVVKEKRDFAITGMTCAACSARIEKVLNKMDGVSFAGVNLAIEKATVEYNPTQLSPKEIVQRIEKIGYGAIIDDPKEAGDYRQKEIQKQTTKLIVSAVLSFPLLWAIVRHFSFTSIIYLPDFLMNPFVQMALATPVQFLIGWQFYMGAYKALRNKSANMDVLVVLGTSAAYFYRVYQAIIY